MSLNSLKYISPSTSIEELVEAGIVPEWMWRDIEPHGMSEAENILCEFDWEWGWDIGDGYNKKQLEILAEVRKTISEGIKVFKSNAELRKIEKDKRDAQGLKEQKLKDYCEKYRGYVFQHCIPWLVEYEDKYGVLPYFFLLCMKYIWYPGNQTDRMKAKLAVAGIDRDEPMSIEEAMEAFPQFSKASLKRMAKQPWNTTGRAKEYISMLHTQLPDRPLTESDPFWAELMERQSLTSPVTPLRVMRMISRFRGDYELTVNIEGTHTLKKK